MKRFYVALLLLISIITLSLFFNNTIRNKSEELILLTETDSSSDEIYIWWNKNKNWFEILVPEELKKGVEANIILYHNWKENEHMRALIKTSAEKILDSTQISISNIF